MRCGCEACALADIACGMNSWKNDRSVSGRSWQASRIDGSVAPTRLSTNASRYDGCGSVLQSPITRIRQVEQRARPPHTLACGHVVAQARFQHAEAFRHPNRAAIAIGQIDHAGAALGDRARAACQQHQSDQAEIADQEIIGDVIQHLLLGRRCRPAARERFCARHSASVAVGDDGSAALIKPQQRQRRNQHRRGEQERRGAP